MSDGLQSTLIREMLRGKKTLLLGNCLKEEKKPQEENSTTMRGGGGGVVYPK